jgi:hypothetical protein
MSNPFQDIREFEEGKVMNQAISVILETVKELKEKLGDLKEGQKQIREDLRNIDKLRALKK